MFQNKSVDRLNRWFGEQLGFNANGEPYFKWEWAPDIWMLRQDGPGYERIRAAETLGKSWVITQWRPTPMPKSMWDAKFKGLFPYPERGTRYVQSETALTYGVEPDAELTAMVIRSIKERHMDPTEQQILGSIMEDIQKERDANYAEFMSMADDSFPAFWKNGQGHEPGTRGAHVSFGGV